MAGLQEEESFHCHTRPAGEHLQGLLEDGLRERQQLHCHALWYCGEGQGELIYLLHNLQELSLNSTDHSFLKSMLYFV